MSSPNPGTVPIEVQQQMQAMYATLQQQMQQQIAQATSAAASSPSAGASRVHLPKIRQPSTFNGTIGLAVDHWLSEMDQQFVYYNQAGMLPTDCSRIQYAAAYLEGIARQWWEQQADRTTLNDWATFVDRLHTRFRPIQASMLARQRLDKLRMREGTSVNGYIGQFHAITMPITDMGPNDLIHAFARGLTHRLASKVWERNPKTLQEAIDYAVIAEASGLYAFRGTHPAANHSSGYRSMPSSSSSNMGSAPMDLNHIAFDLSDEAEPLNGSDGSASSTQAGSGSSSRTDVEALVQAAVDQRLNAMMSNVKFGNGGYRAGRGSSSSSSSKDHVPGLKSEDIVRLMKENRCFRCKQVGHRKDDPKCPKNPKSKNE
jgi:hypothetical protein